MGGNRAGNPAAAVQIDQHRQRLGASGRIEACGEPGGDLHLRASLPGWAARG